MKGHLIVQITVWRLEDDGIPPTKMVVHEGSATEKGGWISGDFTSCLVDEPSRKKLLGFTYEPTLREGGE